MKTPQAFLSYLAALVMILTPYFGHSSRLSDSMPGTVSIRYIGTIQSNPVLQLKFKAEAGERLLISFRNDAGEDLYTQTFNGGEYSRKFCFNGATVQELSLELVIYSQKTKKTTKYLISSESHIVHDLAINQMKF